MSHKQAFWAGGVSCVSGGCGHAMCVCECQRVSRLGWFGLGRLALASSGWDTLWAHWDCPAHGVCLRLGGMILKLWGLPPIRCYIDSQHN